MRGRDRWRAEAPGIHYDAGERASAWLDSDALTRVLEAFGGDAVPRSAEELAAWSRVTLDKRAGRERQVVPPVAWSDKQADVLIEAAGPLGLLRTPEPACSKYDHTIVMAGTTTANRLRSALAERTERSGIGLGTVVGLASDRPIPNWDRAQHADAVHEVEWADLQAVLATRLAAQPQHASRNSDIDLTYKHPAGRELRILSAPSSDPRRRADSTDAFDFLVRWQLRSLGSILILTSAIYVPYTYFVATDRLDIPGVEAIEVIGTPTSTETNRSTLPQRIAQEISASLQAIARHVPSHAEGRRQGANRRSDRHQAR